MANCNLCATLREACTSHYISHLLLVMGWVSTRSWAFLNSAAKVVFSVLFCEIFVHCKLTYLCISGSLRWYFRRQASTVTWWWTNFHFTQTDTRVMTKPKRNHETQSSNVYLSRDSKKAAKWIVHLCFQFWILKLEDICSTRFVQF